MPGKIHSYQLSLHGTTCSSALWRANFKLSHSTFTLSKEDLFNRFLARKQERNSIRYLPRTDAGSGFTHLLQCTWSGQTLPSQAVLVGVWQWWRTKLKEVSAYTALHKQRDSMLFPHGSYFTGKKRRLTSSSNSSTRHCKDRKAFQEIFFIIIVLPGTPSWLGQEKDIPPHPSRWHTGPGGQLSFAYLPGRSPLASLQSWPASPSCWQSLGSHLARRVRASVSPCRCRPPRPSCSLLQLPPVPPQAPRGLVLPPGPSTSPSCCRPKCKSTWPKRWEQWLRAARRSSPEHAALPRHCSPWSKGSFMIQLLNQ